MQHRSINQRLKRAKSPESKAAALSDWAASWQNEQMMLIDKLGKANAKDDFDAMSILIGELRTMSAKKFEALPGVLSSLIKHD